MKSWLNPERIWQPVLIRVEHEILKFSGKDPKSLGSWPIVSSFHQERSGLRLGLRHLWCVNMIATPIVLCSSEGNSLSSALFGRYLFWSSFGVGKCFLCFLNIFQIVYWFPSICSSVLEFAANTCKVFLIPTLEHATYCWSWEKQELSRLIPVIFGDRHWALLIDIAKARRPENWRRLNSKGRSVEMMGIREINTSSSFAQPVAMAASMIWGIRAGYCNCKVWLLSNFCQE